MAGANDPAASLTISSKIDQILSQVELLAIRLDDHEARMAALESKMFLPPLPPTLPSVDSLSPAPQAVDAAPASLQPVLASAADLETPVPAQAPINASPTLVPGNRSRFLDAITAAANFGSPVALKVKAVCDRAASVSFGGALGGEAELDLDLGAVGGGTEGCRFLVGDKEQVALLHDELFPAGVGPRHAPHEPRHLLCSIRLPGEHPLCSVDLSRPCRPWLFMPPFVVKEGKDYKSCLFPWEPGGKFAQHVKAAGRLETSACMETAPVFTGRNQGAGEGKSGDLLTRPSSPKATRAWRFFGEENKESVPDILLFFGKCMAPTFPGNQIKLHANRGGNQGSSQGNKLQSWISFLSSLMFKFCRQESEIVRSVASLFAWEPGGRRDTFPFQWETHELQLKKAIARFARGFWHSSRASCLLPRGVVLWALHPGPRGAQQLCSKAASFGSWKTHNVKQGRATSTWPP